MSLEDKIERLAVAIEKNNELLEKNIQDRQAHVESLSTGGSAPKKAAAAKTEKEEAAPKKAAAKKSADMTEEAFIAHCSQFLGDKASEGHAERKEFFTKVLDGEADEVGGKKNAKTVPAAKRAQVVDWFDKFAKGDETPYSEPAADEDDEDDLLGD